jgi:type II secretory pathway predicted ATPase ExeA
MLQDYFNLSEQPFGVTPDPRFLYLGPQHREALASLLYTTENNRGFVAMIAKPGMGKTSLLYHYLESLRNRARTAFVFRTDCNAREFIRHVLLDLGIDASLDDLPAMHDALNRLLTEDLRAKRRFVLVIDEAQNLSESVLESIRLLSNFETPWTKLMHIVLAGQPQLGDALAKSSMVQLRQRISQIIRIEPFSPQEVTAYIDSRLEAGGCRDLSLFSPGARAAIARCSEGIPRNINNICFNALSLACAMNRKFIDRNIVAEVMSDLALGSPNDEGTVEPELAETKKVTLSQRQVRQKKERSFVGWIPAFALGAVLLASFPLGSQVALNEIRPTPVVRMTKEVVGNGGTSSSLMPAPAATSQRPDLYRAAQAPPSGSVLVFPGQTISGISRAAYGQYNRETLSEIRKLNPWLTDPDRIPAGQEMLLPSSTVSSNNAQRGATQSDASVPLGQVP